MLLTYALILNSKVKSPTYYSTHLCTYPGLQDLYTCVHALPLIVMLVEIGINDDEEFTDNAEEWPS